MLVATLLTIATLAAGETLHLERLPVTVTLPVALAFAPEDYARVYIAEAGGVVRVAVDGVLRDKPFLDISAKVKQPTPSNGEAGFLGIVFDPNHDKRGNLTVYVHYVNLNNQNVVEAHRVKTRNKAKPKPKGAPLLVSQAIGTSHYGGKLNFGPDGYLYTSLGDGGDKPAAQSLDSWRGKIIRFGDSGPESVAYGLRNPWQFSFDATTGDLWIGDVGNSVFEEVNYIAADDATVHNFGWPLREGNWCDGPCQPLANHTIPVLAYYHYAQPPAMQGVCVIGGYVYRGAALPWLYGQYVFADFGSQGKLWARAGDGTITDLKPLYTSDVPFHAPCAFAEDNDGELWIVDYNGADIFKVVP